jgi:putative DNA-invertase from lambdoid prophage Rac
MLLSGRLSPYENLGSASGRLQLAILAALSQFERERLKERTVAGLARARAQGKRLGRPLEPLPVGKLESVKGISVRLGAKRLGVARSTLQRWRALARQNGQWTVGKTATGFSTPLSAHP